MAVLGCMSLVLVIIIIIITTCILIDIIVNGDTSPLGISAVLPA